MEGWGGERGGRGLGVSGDKDSSVPGCQMCHVEVGSRPVARGRGVSCFNF